MAASLKRDLIFYFLRPRMLTYHYHYHYHMGLSAIGPWPAQAMAQDIRYPGVRVGEACGPGVALLGGVEGRKPVSM